MDKAKITRINDLFAKKKSTGLTEEEERERELLHREYLDYIKGQVKAGLDQATAIKSENSCSRSDTNCRHNH